MVVILHLFCRKSSKFEKIMYLYAQIYNTMAEVNRIKVVLVENKRTKMVGRSNGKDQATISKWYTNTAQPSLETLVEIAKIIGVDVRELMMPSEK